MYEIKKKNTNGGVIHKMSSLTATIYDKAAESWIRRSPVALSDYTGRPALFESCGDVADLNIADLGCGEGYCARELVKRGADQVDGIDISQGMINAANIAAGADRKMSFQIGNIKSTPFSSSHYDIAIGAFVYNYLSVKETRLSFKEVHRILKVGGRFIFCVPHPAFPFIHRQNSRPFYFDFKTGGYFSSRDTHATGEIWRLDGLKLPVEMHHKLISDYFDALSAAGFNQIPAIRELGVTEALLTQNHEFFSPLSDVPLHMLFSITK